MALFKRIRERGFLNGVVFHWMDLNRLWRADLRDVLVFRSTLLWADYRVKRVLFPFCPRLILWGRGFVKHRERWVTLGVWWSLWCGVAGGLWGVLRGGGVSGDNALVVGCEGGEGGTGAVAAWSLWMHRCGHGVGSVAGAAGVGVVSGWHRWGWWVRCSVAVVVRCCGVGVGTGVVLC